MFDTEGLKNEKGCMFNTGKLKNERACLSDTERRQNEYGCVFDPEGEVLRAFLSREVLHLNPQQIHLAVRLEAPCGVASQQTSCVAGTHTCPTHCDMGRKVQLEECS